MNLLECKANILCYFRPFAKGLIRPCHIGTKGLFDHFLLSVPIIMHFLIVVALEQAGK